MNAMMDVIREKNAEIERLQARVRELEEIVHPVFIAEDAETYPRPKHGWTCFHCGETFHTVGAAQDHFGDTPIEQPACVINAMPPKILQLTLGQRNIIRTLRKAISRGRRLVEENEQVQYSFATFRDGWRRIGGAISLHDAQCNFESMEGRALAAEAILADVAKRWPALVAASRRRITDGPRSKA